MMSEKNGKRYTPRFKFQVVMEVLNGTKAIGQIARSYGVHPVTLTHWKKEYIEKGQRFSLNRRPSRSTSDGSRSWSG
jgi:transposase-like protein